ncbi:MAG: type I phosphomannose isomerase catalytic subunit [Vicinamibacterales bacterium]
MIPQRLRPDNFTPPERTPWGGRSIVGRLKVGLRLDVDPEVPVGESWEVSTEPSFPSVLDSGERLVDAVAADLAGWLGTDVAAEHGGSPLLVKVIDAAEHLSVQVHPAEDHRLLAEGETGKTEAWIVLGAAPGARIYLGFREGVDARQVEACLTSGGALSALMNEVFVREGEVYLIRPGLAHALGAGTTVLEPQRVRPHRRSITYRYWDWNRGYDERGRVADGGTPRPLHVAEALAATSWRGPQGEALVATARREPVALPSGGRLVRWRLLDEPELWAERWEGTGAAPLPRLGTLMALVCLDGAVEIAWDGGTLALAAGQSAVVPAGAGGVRASLDDAHLALCCVPPTPAPGPRARV